jgi:hypothetical protein
LTLSVVVGTVVVVVVVVVMTAVVIVDGTVLVLFSAFLPALGFRLPEFLAPPPLPLLLRPWVITVSVRRFGGLVL